MKKNSPSVQEIVDQLLRQIYRKQLQPDEKLPPLRSHAEDLGVEPAALRSALKQLETMNLLDIRRSDGTYVKPFPRHAGLDFLARLFAINEPPGDEGLVDEFLVDETLAFWNMVFPEIMYAASRNMSPLDVKAFIDIIDRQIRDVDIIATLVALDIELQDRIAERANNIVVTLLFNSLTPLRHRLTDYFYRKLDRGTRLHFLSMKKKGLCRQMSGNLDLKWSAEEHRKALESYREAIRQATMHHMMQQITGEEKS
ncbi:MAG: FadR/GntR family transcriptional regulator [Thermodesulfobacteriota bacterium]